MEHFCFQHGHRWCGNSRPVQRLLCVWVANILCSKWAPSWLPMSPKCILWKWGCADIEASEETFANVTGVNPFTPIDCYNVTAAAGKYSICVNQGWIWNILVHCGWHCAVYNVLHLQVEKMHQTTCNHSISFWWNLTLVKNHPEKLTKR